MKLAINFPDYIAIEQAEAQVEAIERIVQDPDKHPVLIAVPVAWSETQHQAFIKLVVMLREEIDEGGHVNGS